MKKKDYIKEIREAEKELQELLKQKEALDDKIIVKLSDIQTNCL